jgi:hypothetical protein
MREVAYQFFAQHLHHDLRSFVGSGVL